MGASGGELELIRMDIYPPCGRCGFESRRAAASFDENRDCFDEMKDLSRINAKRRYEVLIALLGDTFEFSKDAMVELRASLGGYWPVYRGFVYRVMRQDGFAVKAIGLAAGYDHSTVVAMTEKLDDILRTRLAPNKRIINAWNEYAFQVRLMDERNAKNDEEK